MKIEREKNIITISDEDFKFEIPVENFTNVTRESYLIVLKLCTQQIDFTIEIDCKTQEEIEHIWSTIFGDSK